MDDNDVAKLLQRTNQASYELLSQLRELLDYYKSALESSSTGVKNLTLGMDALVKARRSRTGLSFTVGAVAIIGGVLTLWYSSSISTGFHQTLLVAIGGALITFCLVELVLARIVEIPAKEAKKIEEEVNNLESLNKQMVDQVQNLLKGGTEVYARLDEVMPQLKRSAFPYES